MLGVRNLFRRVIIGLMASLLIIGYPLSAGADDTAQSPDQSTTTDTSQQTPQSGGEKYYYDAQTGHWNSNRWVWDPVQGKYVRVKKAEPPVIPTQPVAPADTQTSTAPSNVTSTDPGGSSAVLNTDTSTTINNGIKSDATSGDAKVKDNTTAGNATSGNANTSADVLNCINSNLCLQGADMATFTKDIYGNVQGDIMIDPSQFTNTSGVGTNTTPNNLTINSKQSGQINNDIGLNANTGIASVVDNTTAGNATTGNASAMANIVNVINSVIASGQSFMGTVNIYGNLDGDILMPPDVLNNLIASNAEPTVTTTTSPDGKTLTANLANSTSINNNLALNAATGSAAVKDNTTGGNATSGNASTNITLLNLTGQQVIGKDALLVFVNVMGKWVGMIVNAPQGATAAALGGGVVNGTTADNTTVNGSTNNSISNNVSLGATTGNALVAGNTTGGNATSGNASAGVNLVNISTSSISLSNWLGILFINVFGSWNGSFGIDTAAGNLPPSSDGSSQVANAVKQVKVFSFQPASTGNTYTVTPVVSADNPSSNSQDQGPATVLSAETDNNTPSAPHKTYSLFWTAGSLFFLAGVLSTESAFARRKEARANFRRYLDAITVQPFKRY